MNFDKLLLEADRCVKCGICLPHCPTYTLTRDEGDSPRGRISLIQGMASGQLDSPRAQRHLDRCLGCLACEAACPSQVRYGALIDGVRSLQPDSRLKQRQRELIAWLPYRKESALILWLYRFSGIRPLVRLLGGKRLRRLDRLLPKDAHLGRWPAHAPSSEPVQGRIGLFTGCAGRVIDRPALDAAVAVLGQLGYEVIIPRTQGCCGAMHQHAGDQAAAAGMADSNLQAFADQGLDAVVYLASGCGAQLVRQPYPVPVLEISQFLNRCHWPESADLQAMEMTVGIHTPCTLKHQLKLPGEAETLLRRIPGVTLVALEQIDCCGAAGSYLLEQPEMSDRLRERAMDHIGGDDRPLDLLTTSNTGCALQLAGGVRQARLEIEVVHPIELIHRSLKVAPDPHSAH